MLCNLLVSSLFAAGHAGPESERLDVPVSQFRQISVQLDKIRVKDQFESSREYDDRVNAEEKRILPGERLFLAVPSATISYDADARQLEVRTPDFIRFSTNRPQFPWVVVDQELRENGIIQGHTSAGVRVDIAMKELRFYILACTNDDRSLGGLALDKSIRFAVSMSPLRAKSVIRDLKLVVEFQVNRPVRYESWLDYTIKATASKPDQTELHYSKIEGVLRKLILIDRAKNIVAVRKI